MTVVPGVYEDNTCDGELDHAITIVGFGKKRGKDVWLIKNRRVHVIGL